MGTKIIFNGKAYTKVEDMPEDVRQAYQKALEQFVDADKNGVPDILEGHGAGNVITIQQSSFSVNGREFKSVGEMPPIVRALINLALGQEDANQNGIPDPLEAALSEAAKPASSPGAALPASSTTSGRASSNLSSQSAQVMPALEQTVNAPEAFLRVLLGIVVLVTLGGALFLMLKLDASSRSQGGRFYVAIGALVILAAVDSQFRKLLERRQPFSLATTDAERRYALVGLSLLVFAAALLIGFACVLP